MGRRGRAAPEAREGVATLGVVAEEYAQRAIEGVDLVMYGRATNDPRSMAEIETADMETLTAVIAAAFEAGAHHGIPRPRGKR